MQNLPNLWQENSVSPQSNNSLSLYTGDLSDKCLLTAVANVRKAFPALPKDFYDVFMDRIKANGFNDTRLIDAVSHVIDNCPYPTPTIANFISFDKRIKLFSYADYVDMVNKYGPEINDTYKPVQLPGREKPVWINIDDIKIAKLENCLII